ADGRAQPPPTGGPMTDMETGRDHRAAAIQRTSRHLAAAVALASEVRAALQRRPAAPDTEVLDRIAAAYERYRSELAGSGGQKQAPPPPASSDRRRGGLRQALRDLADAAVADWLDTYRR